MKLLTVVGARPQFIKAAMVSRVLRESGTTANGMHEILVHTGQHFDIGMSQIFFDELQIPEPDYNLGVSGGRHGAMTGRMLIELEKTILVEKPDIVMVYGDTNSTLAGALAAAKSHVPVAHIEAGLRSYNMRMPEEINRRLTDHVSVLLFCPTSMAVNNLAKEGLIHGVFNVGDVMYDAALCYQSRLSDEALPDGISTPGNHYAVATIHRAENTDHPERLSSILMALGRIAEFMEVVIPMHPRTMQCIRESGLERGLSPLTILKPQSYLSMMKLVMKSAVVLTDSGGLQKEAFFFRVPCMTLRDETEWIELVEIGWNTVCGVQTEGILNAWNNVLCSRGEEAYPYGSGDAANKIVEKLAEFLNQ